MADMPRIWWKWPHPQEQVRGHSSGASRSLQGQMDAEAGTKKSKKGRGKKSGKAGKKTYGTQAAPKTQVSMVVPVISVWKVS